MAAAVENSARKVNYWGSNPIEVTDVTWNNGDTFVTEFADITAAFFEPTTNASHGLLLSGTPVNTVTLESGGSLTGKLIVIG